jgi:hypothetical protein
MGGLYSKSLENKDNDAMTHSGSECVINDAMFGGSVNPSMTHCYSNDAFMTQFKECVIAIFTSIYRDFNGVSDVMTYYKRNVTSIHTRTTRAHMRMGFGVECVIASQVSL